MTKAAPSEKEPQSSPRRRRPWLGRIGWHSAVNTLLVGLSFITAWRLATWPRPGTEPPFDLDPPAVRIGSRALDQAALTRNRNIVLVASPTCPVCRNSVGLYRALSAFAEQQSQWGFIAVGQQNEQWIQGEGIRARVVDEKLNVGIWATPTLLLVDRQGIVTDILVGFVTARLESHLWDRLDQVKRTPPLDNSVIPTRVTQSEFDAAQIARSRLQLVDFRRRDPRNVSHPEAVQIPLSEVAQRADEELSRNGPVLLDCTLPRIGEAECLVAAIPFRVLGFQDIRMLVRDSKAR